MATDERILKVITRLESDQQAANKTKADIAAHKQALAALEQQQESLDRANADARSAETRLGQARESSTRSLLENRQAVVRAEQAMHDYESSIESAARAYEESVARANRADGNRSGGGTGGSRLESVDRVGSVGSQVLSGLGQGEAANAAGLVGDLAGAFTTLNPAMLAVTATGAGVALIFSDIQRQMQHTREQGELFAKQQVENADLVASGATREDVLQRINNLRGASDFITGQLEQLNDLRQQWDEVTDSAFGLGSAIEVMTDPEKRRRADEIAKAIEAITGQPVENIDQLNEQIKALTAEGNTYQLSIANLQQLVKSGALSANNAAAAALALADADRQRADAAAAALRSEFAFRQQAAQIRETGTSEQLQAMYRQNEQEYLLNEERIRRLTPLAAASESVAQEVEQLTARNEELTSQNNLLRQSVEPVIQQREREAAAAERQKEAVDQVFDAQERMVAAQEAAREASDQYRDALDKQRDTLSRIDADLREKEAALYAQDAAERLDAERKQYQEREKIAEETQERLADIDARAGREFGNARARRDVLAAIQAQQTAQDERAQAAKDAERRKDDLDDNLQEQARVQRQRLEEQLRTAKTSAQRAIQVENERARAELATRAQAAQAAAVQVTNTEQNLLNIQRYYNGLMEQEAYRAGAAQVAAYEAGQGNSTGKISGNAPYPTTQIPATSGGKQVNINIKSTSQASMERQVVKALRQVYA